jgi:hydroxyacylglutathione hydrolase
MKIEQIYTGCLAEAAYYIESNGEAVIIDPLRDTRPYLDRLEEDKAKLKYVMLTHFHADFVAGHLDLKEATGAPIVFGPNATAGYDIYQAKDGEIFNVGDITIELLHTPGHTMESSTYLLRDEKGKEHSIYTGDTLFIGDVGRPDLAVKSDLTQEDLAGHLYESLRNKLMVLPDDVIVYPNHGAGSACGKMMSEETFDTLGHQKEVNYALQDMTKQEFIDKVLDGLAPPPQYFPKNAMLNKTGYDLLDEVMSHARHALDCEHVDNLIKDGALVLDTREHTEFQKGFIPGSVNIGLDGNFAPWVGTLIKDLDRAIVLIAEEERVDEAIIRLSRVGYDNTVGYLAGGVKAWQNSGRQLEVIEAISPYAFNKLYKDDPSIKIIDTRRKSEYDSEHIEGSEVLTLDTIDQNMDVLDKEQKHFLYCLTGYRSASLISILRTNGYRNLINIEGGMEALKETEVPFSEYVCPTTLL